MNASLAAAFALNLKEFPNDELAALNNALAFGHGSKIPPNNIAFERASKLTLIKPSGAPFDGEALEAALSLEINKRVDAETFV